MVKWMIDLCIRLFVANGREYVFTESEIAVYDAMKLRVWKKEGSHMTNLIEFAEDCSESKFLD